MINDIPYSILLRFTRLLAHLYTHTQLVHAILYILRYMSRCPYTLEISRIDGSVCEFALCNITEVVTDSPTMSHVHVTCQLSPLHRRPTTQSANRVRGGRGLEAISLSVKLQIRYSVLFLYCLFAEVHVA